MNRTKTVSLVLLLILLLGYRSVKADETLILHYNFTSSTEGVVDDLSGNGNNGTLLNGATLSYLDTYPVADLGGENGYIDMGASTGSLMSTLTDFTVAINIYIDEAASITGNGNFVWAFSTSAACTQTSGKYIAYRVNRQRYAQSTGGWGSEDVAVEAGYAASKGEWLNVVYTQTGTTGTLYLNGAVLSTGTAAYSPQDIGEATAYNWLGRPQFSGDAYLQNTLLNDFRIYNRALDASEVSTLASTISDMNLALSRQEVIDAKDELVLESPVTNDISLPTSVGNDVSVSWSSDKPDFISNEGEVTRPAYGQTEEVVTLTATLSKDGYEETKDFEITVVPSITDEESVTADANALAIDNGYCRYQDIYLPTEGQEGSTITWVSDQPQYLSSTGALITLPETGSGNVTVNLTASISKGSITETRTFEVCIAEDEGYTSYLFAYFTGNTGDEEAIRYAISNDGMNFKTINDNNPIIASDTISYFGGVRDPHILRGVDGESFYMAVTDMKSALGWSSNHGMVLLKSNDLVNWTHTAIDVQTRFPAFAAINRAWAPQTIYDPIEQKYMVYWSMKEGDVKDIIYYAYTNDDFTDFVSDPEVLFDYPTSCIDGDIIYKDGQYHMFFKTEGSGNGIKRAVADKVNGPYTVEEDKYLQQTTEAVEGSCVFRLINSNTYILMYDLYASGKYQLTESTDLSNFSVINSSMDFHPRHGTVIPITDEEAERIAAKWGTVNNLYFQSVDAPEAKSNNVVIDDSNMTVHIPVVPGTDIEAFDPQIISLPGVQVSPAGAQDFSLGSMIYTLSIGDLSVNYTVTARVEGNPVLDGFYADPQVLYSHKTNKFYIYPTSDGFDSWGGYYFKVFSSDDLVDWTDEGVILNMQEGDVAWADGNAWAPTIVEKMIDGEYKYFYYFSGNTINGTGKQIGVAVADDPTGPFVAASEPMITSAPSGAGGQQIDPCVFTDPVSGKSYIYWGNAYMAGAELNDDMVSIKEETMVLMTPSGGSLSTYAYREGAFVFYRDGLYYFMWSVDDTGAANYHVAYGTSDSPLGAITVAASPIVIIQDAANEIYGTGHNSVLQIPGKDEWYIVYHRINAAYINDGPGYHREVCIDKLEFNEDGTIKQTTPTAEGIQAVDITTSIDGETISIEANVYPNPMGEFVYVDVKELIAGDCTFSLYSQSGVLLESINCTQGQNQLNTDGLSKGIYIGILKTGNKEVSYKLLKK